MPTLYRIVRGRQFVIEDVRSNLARCKPRRASELLDIAEWAGVSTFDTPERAGYTARLHHMGTQLARLDVPADDSRVVLSPRSSSGHVTVWACEQVLASFVKGCPAQFCVIR